MLPRLILILLIVLPQLVMGQYDYSSRCVRAHELISALRFEEARQLIHEEKVERPTNLVPVMLEGYMDFLTLVVGQDEHDYDSLRQQRSLRIDRLREGDPGSPWYLSAVAQVNLQWAFARVSFGSYFYAARDIRRAYLLLEQNSRMFPGFLPDQVGLGIMHALIGTIPGHLDWIANLFSMDGSVVEGRSELIHVLEHADEQGYPFLTDEALFFLSFVDLNLQADEQRALALLSHYDNEADSNLMLLFALSKIYMMNEETDKAIALLINRPVGDEYYPFYYLDYLTGLAKLNRLDTDAEEYFLRFTTNFKGRSFIKSAYQRLAWCSLLKKDSSGYFNYMDRVKNFGSDLSDGDKLALRNAVQERVPNECLLRARLLFDGGYYARADSVLSDPSCVLSNLRDTIEISYRKGRIAQAVGNTTEALKQYRNTINLGEDEPYYYAANAALQAGKIFESQGELTNAGTYYRMSLEMKNEEYRNSIRQKARAGLNRIEN